MQTVELLRRILKHYSVDLTLAVVFMLVAFVYVYDQPTLLSAIARKVALASAGLVYYYTTRVLKVGFIDWRDPYDKIYTIALLIYIGLVFALG
jgi:prepilin signal peptidase PulO-like enzyme (type II secretory pathway)